VRPDRLVGELRFVAAPDEQLPGAVAVALVLKRGREAAGEQLDGGRQLALVATVCERRLDQVGRHPALLEVAGDALAAPPVQRELVLGEAPRVAGVVDVAARLEIGQGELESLAADAAPLERRPQLGFRPVALRQRLPGELQRLPDLVLRYAAFSSGSVASASAPSIGTTVRPSFGSCGSIPAAS
jgi:hypothetical protein